MGWERYALAAGPVLLFQIAAIQTVAVFDAQLLAFLASFKDWQALIASAIAIAGIGYQVREQGRATRKQLESQASLVATEISSRERMERLRMAHALRRDLIMIFRAATRFIALEKALREEGAKSLFWTLMEQNCGIRRAAGFKRWGAELGVFELGAISLYEVESAYADLQAISAAIRTAGHQFTKLKPAEESIFDQRPNANDLRIAQHCAAACRFAMDDLRNALPDQIYIIHWENYAKMDIDALNEVVGQVLSSFANVKPPSPPGTLG